MIRQKIDCIDGHFKWTDVRGHNELVFIAQMGDGKQEWIAWIEDLGSNTENGEYLFEIASDARPSFKYKKVPVFKVKKIGLLPTPNIPKGTVLPFKLDPKTGKWSHKETLSGGIHITVIPETMPDSDTSVTRRRFDIESSKGTYRSSDGRRRIITAVLGREHKSKNRRKREKKKKPRQNNVRMSDMHQDIEDALAS